GDTDPGGWAATAVRLLRQAVPDNPWNNPAAWPAWRQMLPHALAATDPGRDLALVSNEVAWLLDHAAIYLQSSGDPRAALPLFQRAHDLSRPRLGADPPDTLATRHRLGHAYEAAGRLSEAIPLFEATLADRRRILGADHLDTLATRHRLAYAYEAAGRL